MQRHQEEFGAGENKTLVLRGVGAEIPFGEMTLLVGPSGWGKTTLISVIAGLLDASQGELTVLGKDLRRLRGAEAVRFRRENLGFAFQQYNLLPALTAAENAAVPLLAVGMPRTRAIEKSSQLLWELGLGHRLETLPSNLSGGQQQRIAVRPDRAVIVVTHDSRVYEFADRIAYMEDGRVTRISLEEELLAANVH